MYYVRTKTINLGRRIVCVVKNKNNVTIYANFVLCPLLIKSKNKIILNTSH
jgi:hypothetical protein